MRGHSGRDQNDTRAPGQIWSGGTTPLVDESVRKVDKALMTTATNSLVETRLITLQPHLEAHFGVWLNHCEPLQFLRYRDGHFYQMRRDSDTDANSDPTVHSRQVSVSIFLNRQNIEPHPDTFVGGLLTFYGLLAIYASPQSACHSSARQDSSSPYAPIPCMTSNRSSGARATRSPPGSPERGLPPSTFFFTSFELLLARGFLDAELCARPRAEIRAIIK